MPASLLHVEPDAAEAVILRSVLRDVWPERFRTIHAETLTAGLEVLGEGGVDCILLSARAGDPLAALAILRRLEDRVPVVVLTDDDEGEIGLRAVRGGAQDHLVQGADGYAVGRALLYAVERQRAEGRTFLERDRRERELRRLADEDSLTHLLNRRRFLEELDRTASLAARYRRSGALAIIELGSLRAVNDAWGLRAGDEMLARAAGIVRDRLRRTDQVGRLGSEEFGVLLPEVGAETAGQVARELVEALGGLRVGGAPTGVTACAGFAAFDAAQAPAADALLARADAALAAARAVGPGSVRGGGSASIPAGHQAGGWEGALRAALRDDAFVLVLQPIAGLRGGTLPRREVLLRMSGEDGELVPPGDFLPTAARAGLSTEIDAWVIARTAELAAAEAEAGRPAVFQINLCSASVADPGLAERIRAAIAAARVDPALLVFEVAEADAASDLPRTRALAAELRALGCAFALDDVGRGPASLSYLDVLAFDELKIDITLAAGVAHGRARRAIVEAVVAIAGESGASTVAEGVADPQAAEVLRQLGVDYAQGWLYGAPEPLETARTV